MIERDQMARLLPEWLEIRNDPYRLAEEISTCLRCVDLYKPTHLDDLALGASASPVLMVVMAASPDPEVRLAIARRKSFLANVKVVARLLYDEDERVRLASLKFGLDWLTVLTACPKIFKYLRFRDAIMVFFGAMTHALSGGVQAAIMRGEREEFILGERIARSMGLTIVPPR